MAKDMCRVVIQVQDEPDALERIALLNNTFLRVATGARLVEVLMADYETGCMEVIIQDGRVRPQGEGGVAVRYMSVHVGQD